MRNYLAQLSSRVEFVWLSSESPHGMNGTCSPSRLQLAAQPSAVLKLDGHPDGFKRQGINLIEAS